MTKQTLINIIFKPIELIAGYHLYSYILMLFIGVMIGTHAIFAFQVVAVVYYILFLNSWSCRQYEIGSLIFAISFVAFIIGIIIGDISFLMQSGSSIALNDIGSFLEFLFLVD